jgi:hypothetical protein
MVRYEPQFKTTIAVVFSSFIGKLGKWVSGRTGRIHELNNVDELVDYIRGDLTIEDSKVRQIISFFK